MKYGELSLGQIEAIVNKLGGMEGAKAFLSGERIVQRRQTSPSSFSIQVDYSQSLAEMIKAGAYDWKNDEITSERFPLNGEGVVQSTVHVLHYDRAMYSMEVIIAMEEGGYVSALIEDLLAFGAKYPEEQRKYPIFALGSPPKGYRDGYAPYLDGRGGWRNLGLDRSSYRWNENCRFLARSKDSDHRT